MEGKKGSIAVVGIGPGGAAGMTLEAAQALKEASCIIGYQVYVDLVKEGYPDTRFLTTPMRKEAERCELAFSEAEKGENVAFICSGDPGVYGMAGLIFTMGKKHPDIPVRIVPGVTAALSGAALLGAPLIHDFCVISLSDLLTPWETIEKRLLAAAEADLCIVLYNPASRRRPDHLKNAFSILRRILPGNRVCGLVRSVGRAEEASSVLTLAELEETQADMFTTVFIGNASTRVIGGRMVTPRGYEVE